MPQRQADPLKIAAPEVRGPGPIRAGLVVVYLVGLYTYVPLTVLPGPAIPAFVAGGAGFLLLLLNLPRLRPRATWPLAAYLGLALWGLAVAPEAARYFSDRAQSWIYLLYSVIASVGLFMEVSRWSRDQIARIFLIASALILIGSYLESYTPFGHISDVVRRAVFQTGVYAADQRDILLFGRVRPKLFTSEPSHLAKFFLLSVTIWLSLTRTRHKYLAYGLMGAVGLYLIRSPIVILVAATAGVVRVYLDMPGITRTVLGRYVRPKLVLVGMASALALLVALAGVTILAARLDRVISGADESFLLRIAAPAVIAGETMAHHPLFGVGIGGNEALVNEMQSAFTDLGIETERFDDVTEKLFNVFWMHWIYFGALGGVVAILLMGLYARNVGARNYAFVVFMTLIFSQTMGGYNGIRNWSYFMLILVTGRIHWLEGKEAATLAARDLPGSGAHSGYSPA